MQDAWLALVAFVAFSLLVPAGMALVGRVLAVRARQSTQLKYQTYECGEDPAGPVWVKFHPRYYVVALFFVLFDVEAAFMVPWAVIVREIGVAGIVEMFVFVGILLVGWAYALRKGTLKWQ